MYQKKVDPTGLSVSTNRVSVPEVDSPEETYSQLDKDKFLGLRLAFDNWGLKAVLCKNTSGTLISKWRATESKPYHIEDVNLTDAVYAGAEKISVATTLSADNLPVDILGGGFLWIVGGKGLSPQGGFRKLLIKGNEVGDGIGPIELELLSPVPFDLDITTDVIAYSHSYGYTQEGSQVGGNKHTGHTLVDVEDDQYYWAVYEGDIPAQVAATAIIGEALEKGGNGAYIPVPAITEINTATLKFQGAQDIITLHIPGIYQQYGS